MSTLTPDILTGFLAEAQGYLDALHEALAGGDDTPGQDHIQEIHRLIHTLGGAAAMLDLPEVAALATSAEKHLDPLLEGDNGLSDKIRGKLTTAVEDIEQRLKALADSNGGPAAEPPMQAPPQTSDLPPELLEIFVLEAQEHSKVIHDGLERLRKDATDTATLSEVRRATHTLKGAAAAVGIELIARLAHQMEDLTEGFLEREEALTPEATDLLLDSADALEEMIEPQEDDSGSALLESIDERYAKLLGAAYTPFPVPLPSAEPEGEAPPRQHLRSEDLLRIPLADIDQLINRVGEIVINRAAFEGHLGSLDELLVALGHSTRRLRQVAQDIDTQVEATPMAGVGDHDTYEIFDPLELDRYTLLHQLARELEEVAADTGNVNSDLHLLADEFDATLIRERRLTTELQDGLMATRLVTFREIETRLRQTVRRAAHDLDKSVELILVGFDTEVDKTILNALVDGLMHMLRNAVDHGIEPPEAREAAGKPPTGQITLRMSRERGRAVISLSDDGAGIDLKAVLKHAVEAGLIGKEETPDQEELLNVLFEEGFSLAEQVTQTSGRGIGLNIVQRAVRSLQGTVRISTSSGRGTTFTISVPVTLAITRALFVGSGQQVFAVPLEQIASVMRLPASARDEFQEEGILRSEGRVLSVYELAAFTQEQVADVEAQRYGLVVESGGQPTVVLVDTLVGTREAVIKSLGTHLRRVHGIAGATITGDGHVVLILDLPELIGSEDASPWVADASPPNAWQKPQSGKLHVLVVDDSLSVRRVVCSFLERSGWQATSAKDGIEALDGMATMRPDVALVDIEMPRMNGYELLSRMRADANLQDIPVVFLTSRSATKHRERAGQLGVDGYLVKPYREDELLEELIRVTRVEV